MAQYDKKINDTISILSSNSSVEETVEKSVFGKKKRKFSSADENDENEDNIKIDDVIINYNNYDNNNYSIFTCN